MNKQIINPKFPDLYTFILYSGDFISEYLIKAGTSEISDPDFLETNFRYFQDKLEFGSPDLLSELESSDKLRIGEDGIFGIEKYLITLFPTLSRDTSGDTNNVRYFSSVTKMGGDELICLQIPEEIDNISVLDSNGDEALKIWFEGDEILDSKVIWIITSFTPESPRIINLSYEAYKGDRNPVRRMSEYVLRNDDLTENRKGYSEKDGYLYSDISGSLIGTSKIVRRPIYDMMCGLSGNGWNRAKRYSVGDTIMMGDTRYESVESGNIGNHPYYSRKWIKKYDN